MGDVISYEDQTETYADDVLIVDAEMEEKCQNATATGCHDGMGMRLHTTAAECTLHKEDVQDDDGACSECSTAYVCSRYVSTTDVSEFETATSVDHPKHDDLRLSVRQISVPITPENSTIIFDWDDTLMPTCFIKDIHHMCPPQYKYRKPAGCNDMQDFPCFPAFQRHAKVVQRLLTAARSVAHVAIVTLADRSWFFNSDRYLPGLQLPELLEKLEIPVYYALEHSHSSDEDENEDLIDCKCRAMSEFLKQVYCGTGARVNVLSIGDSLIEKDAIKKAVDTFEGNKEESTTRSPLCKRVKLMDNPSLKQLSTQLDFITERVDRMITYGTCFDFTAEANGTWETQAESLLALESSMCG